MSNLIDWVLRRSLPPPPSPTKRGEDDRERAARERREAASRREHARIMAEQARARAELDYTAAVLATWGIDRAHTEGDDAPA